MRDDLFSKLSDNQLKQQVLVLLGYAPDTIQVDEVSFAYCFFNFFSIFKTDNDRAFNVSQRNSLDCILGKKTYSDCIDSLIMGNTKSFILAPLASAPHISFCVIYKSKNGANFNCTVINKKNNCPRSYLQYTIPKDNMHNIVSILGYKSMQFITLDQFLSAFDSNCSKFSNLDFSQSTTSEIAETNYIIEIESAFSFAYSKAFLFKYFKDNTTISTKSNWDISNAKSNHFNVVGPFESSLIREKYLDNVEARYPNLSSYINEVLSIKEKNDKFYIEFSQDNDFKIAEFFFKLAFNYDETNNIEDCIKDIDAKNLASNFDFIYHLCQQNNLDTYVSTLDILKPLLIDKNADLSNFLANLDTLESLFPLVTFQLSAIHSNYYLIYALENYNCAMNMINDMLNIAQTVNDRLALDDIYDEYFTPYDDIHFEYPLSSSSQKEDILPTRSTSSASLSDDYYTPKEDIHFEYLTNKNNKLTTSKHTSLYSDTRSYKPNSIHFSNIYDMDNSFNKEVDMKDYINPDSFKNTVTSLLVKSLETCCNSISMDADNALCHYILGISLLYLGRSQEAQLEFAESLELIPSNSDFCVLNAVCLILNNKMDNAKSSLEASLEIDPQNYDAKKLNEILLETDPDAIKDAVIDLYKLNYLDISLELSHTIDSLALDYNSLYDNTRFSYVPVIISDTVSSLSELEHNHLTPSFNSFEALNKYSSGVLDNKLNVSVNSLYNIPKSVSDILNNKRRYSLDNILNKKDSSNNLSKSVGSLININPDTKKHHLNEKSIKHKSIDI